MKYVARAASGDNIYILIFTKIGIDIQKFIGRHTQTHTQIQQDDLIRLSLFL